MQGFPLLCIKPEFAAAACGLLELETCIFETLLWRFPAVQRGSWSGHAFRPARGGTTFSRMTVVVWSTPLLHHLQRWFDLEHLRKPSGPSGIH